MSFNNENNSAEILPNSYIAVDLETSGIDPESDEILELCAIKVIDGSINDIFHTLIKPRKEVSQHILDISNIDSEELNSAKDISEVFPELVDFIGDYVIISHNIYFSYNFINRGCTLANIPTFANSYVDTKELAEMMIDDIPNYKLSTLVSYFKLPLYFERTLVNETKSCVNLYNKLRDFLIALY